MPRPGQISIDDVRKVAANISTDTLILPHIRSHDEGNASMMRDAKAST
jgi:hypothetical protein